MLRNLASGLISEASTNDDFYQAVEDYLVARVAQGILILCGESSKSTSASEEIVAEAGDSSSSDTPAIDSSHIESDVSSNARSLEIHFYGPMGGQVNISSPGASQQVNYVSNPSGEGSESLRVSIAILVRGECLLLVRRRESYRGLSWQFPAGVIKPGQADREVVVGETYAETGVHCQVRNKLGKRVHPITSVICEYYYCEYVSGEPNNRDPVENSTVSWVNYRKIHRLIPMYQIYEPVIGCLLEMENSRI
jgi:8-oxo-dGTP pyrophosphatase MutT (NUDIX family)